VSHVILPQQLKSRSGLLFWQQFYVIFKVWFKSCQRRC